MSSQLGYARREADYLLGSPPDELGLVDRLRLKCWLMPLMVMPYTLLWRRCILNGSAGFYYALQRQFAETAIAIEIMDRRLRARTATEPRQDR